ncbi:MAG TPA: M28 family peptidase [Blastocatellia bacterium]|nr:M28 family peptidase [Blastocatellia bacterium]
MKSYSIRLLALLVLMSLVAAAGEAQQQKAESFTITPDIRAALDHISADSLRGHLSFIASDLLEGRNTPSRGLDIAAEYIAAQFRRSGLEPVGDDGYFQTANWLLAERSMEDFELRLQSNGETINVGTRQVSLAVEGRVELSRATVFKVDYKDAAALASLTGAQVEGKVILTEIPDYRREERSRWAEMFRAQNEFLNKMSELKAALVISVDRIQQAGSGAGTGRLLNPENRQPPRPSGMPLITAHDPQVVRIYDALKPGPTGATLSLRLSAPVENPVRLRNVIGILRGSDEKLKDTYVLVTAHYDHVGMQAVGEGDRIFNGANDDGSGTVTVIELAAALSKLKQRPRRSIVFMTFFGEEKGLLGSRYYGRHPVFPIEKTVAHVNLEQVGRTDSSEGPQLTTASLTGFDFSDIGKTFKAAGDIVGVNVYKHERNSDPFFSRSDNQALADQGVPAHTLCVAFLYPDYHRVGDHWEKIDYANMEKINRLVAVGLLMIAESAQEPAWNEANPKTARYVKAWKDRRGLN